MATATPHFGDQWGEVGDVVRKPLPESRPRAWRPFVVGACVAAAAVLTFVGWTILDLGGRSATTAFHDTSWIAAGLAAALSCAVASWRSEGRMRAAWALFAASTMSWTSGMAAWFVYEVILRSNVPDVSVAEVGFLVAIPLAIAGILAWPAAPTSKLTRGRALIDGALVALSVFYVSWVLDFGAVFRGTHGLGAGEWLELADPVGDGIIGSVLLLALRRVGGSQRGTLLLLLGGLAGDAIADSGSALFTGTPAYGTLGSLLGSGWIIGYSLIALAPLWPLGAEAPAAQEETEALWQVLVPWICLVAIMASSVAVIATGGKIDPFVTYPSGLVVLLVMASELMTYRQSLSRLRESRRSQRAFRARTNLLNQVVTHAPLGVGRVSVDGHFIDANPRLASLLRVPVIAFAGARVAGFLSPATMAQMVEKYRPLRRGAADSAELEGEVRRGDGTSAWLRWSTTAIRKPDGTIDYYLAMAEDITARHEAEETALANLSGLERLNHLKSEFVSMVSHEFRTALVGIQGFSELLRDQEMDHGEVGEIALDINNEALRLNRMIGEMLDLDRIEAGKIRLAVSAIHLNEILETAVERGRVSSSKHSFTLDLDPQLPEISGDSDRLTQVVANLISNATKYSAKGGEIKVSSRWNGDAVEVSIQDQGDGIPPEFVGRLFERYERFEDTKGAKIVGTGLGLAISRQILELHGGRIWVESQLGAGSTFNFSLPISPS